MTTREKKRRAGKKRHPVLRLFKFLLLFCMLAVLAAGGTFAYLFLPKLRILQENAIKTCSSMSEADFRMRPDTEIYDADNARIGRINAGHYEYVPYDELSPWIRKAYIDQEDRRFYSHHGVDFQALARAFISYLKNRRITQGGSTITQQVIKNTYLSQERTIDRKITEILIAPQLEDKFGKDKILEFYCNGNFFAHGCYGIGAASRYYFNKSASELEPWEAAVLAGISNRPATYEPVNHPENAKKKRNEILNSMYECGDLTEKELKEYQAKPLVISTEHEATLPENYQVSYALYCAALQLMRNEGFVFEYLFDSKAAYQDYQERFREAYAEKSEELRAGGYRIHTTLDSSLQQVVQEELDKALDEISDERQENGKYALQGAAVLVNSQNGSVAAIVGGRGADDQYNRAFLSTRQPGSSIKPLLDYGPAFETGYFYPSYIINDHEFEEGPKNSGGRYHGWLPIREALNRSLNTVAWQLLERIGVRNGLAYLGKMDFSSLSWADVTAPAVSIGGFTNGTRVVEMAKGYACLAAGGVYDERTCLKSLIYDQTGEELLKDNLKKTQVYTEGTAWILTDVLKGTMDKSFGTGRGLDIPGQQAAGKTGTANDSKDTWFCGYTRYYTAAVWMGYDTPRAMPGIYGATVAGKIWQSIMTRVHEGLPELDWTQPLTVVTSNVDYNRGTRVEYNSGVRDYFNLAVDPAARASYEALQGTSEYDPHAWRWVPEETTLPPVTETSTEAETEEEYVPVTGVDGGPGVSPVRRTTADSTETASPIGPGVPRVQPDSQDSGVSGGPVADPGAAPGGEAPAPSPVTEAPAPATEAPAPVPAPEAPAPAPAAPEPAAPAPVEAAPEPATIGPAP